MNLVEAIVSAIYLSLGIAGLVGFAFAHRFEPSGERALTLSATVALLPLIAWHRSVGDPLLIVALSLFSLGAPVALAYGFHSRSKSCDRGLAWAGLALALLLFALYIGWMIASALNFGVGIGLWK